MKFSQLLGLPFGQDGVIDLAAILEALPKTPPEVAKQFLADHGRKSSFQDQYASLDLGLVKWSLEEVDACSLLGASIDSRNIRWFESVGKRTEDFYVKSWDCVDSRKTVCQHWANSQTWIVPPVLLESIEPSTSNRLHLVEGHTRIGLLAGLVQRAIVPSNSRHKAWVGRGGCANFPG